MHKDTLARSFPRKVKEEIAERDSVDGWPCCVMCGAAAPPSPNGISIAWSNAHFISRAQGGLGVTENGLTLCPKCHRRYDQTTDRKAIREYLRGYLESKHADWDEGDLYYEKGMCDV